MHHVATLRLFNGIYVDKESTNYRMLTTKGQMVAAARTIPFGFILDPYIIPDAGIYDAISEAGISNDKANASLHKSWSVVKDSPIEKLVLQQILHYVTTYGYSDVGIYSDDTIYIPHEKLEVPEVDFDVNLRCIKSLSKDAILEGIITLGSGVALAETSLKDIMSLVDYFEFDPSFVKKIKNRELIALLSDYYDILPTEPVAYLRYVISKLTNESLLIKNKYMIDKIKASSGKHLDTLLKDAPEDLASIFLRYKPLFLAMKSISVRKRSFFNKLRKDAEHMHKPLPEDFLNSVTMHIKHGDLSIKTLSEKLKKATLFRKVRLARALNDRVYMGATNNPMVYTVRNGRGFVDIVDFPVSEKATLIRSFNIVLESIADDVRDRVSGKTFYIPKGVKYALPATEKQFTGNFPSGSYVALDKDMVVGIHWFNTNRCIDLDLSAVACTGKVGWDGMYRNSEILFSGDITSAPRPNGASEMFHIKNGLSYPHLLCLNFFNYLGSEDTVDHKIFVAQSPNTAKRNYMVDASKIIMQADVTITKKQNIIGLVYSVKDEIRFGFASMSVGNGITSKRDEKTSNIRNFLARTLAHPVLLEDALILAGANIVHEKPEDESVEFTDLSPESICKTTFLDLLQ